MGHHRSHERALEAFEVLAQPVLIDLGLVGAGANERARHLLGLLDRAQRRLDDHADRADRGARFDEDLVGRDDPVVAARGGRALDVRDHGDLVGRPVDREVELLAGRHRTTGAVDSEHDRSDRVVVSRLTEGVRDRVDVRVGRAAADRDDLYGGVVVGGGRPEVPRDRGGDGGEDDQDGDDHHVSGPRFGDGPGGVGHTTVLDHEFINHWPARGSVQIRMKSEAVRFLSALCPKSPASSVVSVALS